MNCDECGQPRPEEEMIRFADRCICTGCKSAFLQHISAGGLPPESSLAPAGFDERIIDPVALVKLTWKLLCRDWEAIIGVTLLSNAPVGLGLAAIAYFQTFQRSHPFVSMGIRSLLYGLVAIVGSLGVAKIVSGRLEGRPIGLSGAIAHALRRWLPAVWTNFLAGIIVILWALLLIVPGIIWTGYYVFDVSLVSLRGCAGMTALNYCKFLVSGRWWAVAGRWFLLSLVPAVPSYLVQFGMKHITQWPAAIFAAFMVLALFRMFVRVGTTVLFLNLDGMWRRAEPSRALPPRL